MISTLLLSSSSTSSSATATASRDSTGSTSSTNSSTSSFASDLDLLAAGIDVTCDSSHPNSISEDDSGAGDLLIRKLNPNNKSSTTKLASKNYFSLSRFSNVFKKDSKSVVRDPEQSGSGSVKRTSSSSSSSAKEMFRKYLKKVKPFYEKLPHKQQQRSAITTSSRTSSSNMAPFYSKSSSINRSATAPGVDQEITDVTCLRARNLDNNSL